MDNHFINQLISKKSDHYVELLQRLIKIPSYSGQEINIQKTIFEYMQKLGLELTTVFPEGNENSPSISGLLKGKKPDNYKSLIISAHCDTTPVANEQAWEYHPFSGKRKKNCVFGKGAQDDKAGIVVSLFVADLLQSIQKDINGDIFIQSASLDEINGAGSDALVKHGIVADGVIIVDGTWSNRLLYAHLGQLWVNVTVRGTPMSGANAFRTESPFDIAALFITRLKNNLKKLEGDLQPIGDLEEKVVLNIGAVNGGVWHNSVPSAITLKTQISFANGISALKLFEKIKKIGASISDKIIITQAHPGYEPFSAPKDNALIRHLLSKVESVTGRTAETLAFTGFCDMRHFGTDNICLYGPGKGGGSHGINEYYDVDDMTKVVKSIVLFALEWCNEIE